jgi:predicted YcjX-like family ATPase
MFYLKKRIGIIGLSNSGKTVFLTSLINHISEHPNNLEKFDIDEGKNKKIITFFRELPIENEKYWNRFEYKRWKDRFSIENNWPDKTQIPFKYKCELKTNLNKTGKRLIFYDLPGERFSDIEMVNRNYFLWSKKIIDKYSSTDGYLSVFSDYLTLLKKENLNENQILESYKKVLLQLLKLKHCPVITPSSFKLSMKTVDEKDSYEGIITNKMSDSDIVGFQKSGLLDREFAPLPSDFLENPKNKNIVNNFCENYKVYKKIVVMPFYKTLKKCNSLVVLIDIPGILMSGMQNLNNTREIIFEILDSVKPGTNRFKQIFSFIPGINAGIKNIIFAATKADIVKPDDLDNLEKLLKELIAKAYIYNEHGVNINSMCCSAVVSTKISKTQNEYLIGKLKKNFQINVPDEEELVKFIPTNLPEKWPENKWDIEKYSFPLVYPDFPQALHSAPIQYNINNILKLLI